MKELALSIGTTPFKAPPGVPTGGLGPGGAGEKILSWGFTLFLITTTILSLIFLILAGISWITSEGDKTKVASAKAKLTYAIVGLVLALSSFFIVTIIGNLFGVGLITPFSDTCPPPVAGQSPQPC